MLHVAVQVLALLDARADSDECPEYVFIDTPGKVRCQFTSCER
jgi:hypothetical protein